MFDCALSQATTLTFLIRRLQLLWVTAALTSDAAIPTRTGERDRRERAGIAGYRLSAVTLERLNGGTISVALSQ
jgi:hypothetical protein